MIEKQIKILYNNINLAGILEIPTTEKKYPLVVFSSGFGLRGSRSRTRKQMIEKLRLANVECATLTFDYIGMGESEGDISDVTPLNSVYILNRFLMKALEYSQIDKERICLLGSSFGGYVSLIYSSMFRRIKLLALKSPVVDYKEVRERQLSSDEINYWKKNGVIELSNDTSSKYEFYEQACCMDIYNIANKNDSKILIIHGDADENVPLEQSKLLNDIMPNSQIMIMEGVGHDYHEVNDFNIMVDSFVNYIKVEL